MTPTYRLIHFAPNPISGARFPLAASIAWGDGRPDTIVTGHVPGPECLGSMSLHRLAKRFLDDVSGVDDLSSMPTAYETVGRIEEPVILPRVENPEEWLKKFVLLARYGYGEERASYGTVRGPRRSTLGKRFFSQYQMDEIVQHDFKPTRVFDDDEKWSFAPSVAHYAGGSRSLVLVEPLDLRRESYMEDAKKAARDLCVYRNMQPKQESIWTVAMILPCHGFELRRGEVAEHLSHYVDQSVDVVREKERKLLFDALHEAAKSVAA